jgi:HSP20 family protein
MDADEVSVEVSEDMLTISGEREEEREEKREDYSIRERRYGRFVRTVPLPEGVNPDEVQATLRQGLLEITMPLPQRERGRRIDIQSGAEAGAEASRGQAATGR